MNTRIRELVVAAILLFGTIAGARADDTVALGIGDAFRLFLAKAFATVIVGDPLVVEVRTDDDHSVVIEPLSAGQTNLAFVDARDVVIANVRISVCGASSERGCTDDHSS